MFTFRKVLFNQYFSMKALQLYFNWSGKYSVACCGKMITITPHNKNKKFAMYLGSTQVHLAKPCLVLVLEHF